MNAKNTMISSKCPHCGYKSIASQVINGYGYVPVHLVKQGCISVRPDGKDDTIYDDEFWIVKEAKDIVIIETSLVSKYSEVCATSSGTYCGGKCISGPSIWLDKNERTIYLDEQHKDDGWTSLVFPTLIGYSIRGTDFGRYSLTITFIKED